MSKWLLVETFGPSGSAPTVIGMGSSPRGMVPLRDVVRGRNLACITAAITRSFTSGSGIDETDEDTRKRTVVVPLKTFAGTVHGFAVWSSSRDDQPPPRDPAGAWQFNLTTDKISGSDELLDLYGVPLSDRQSERHTAEAFGRLVTNADESAALAKIIRSEAGTEHQATWTVRRDDDELRAAHFSCRAVAEAGPTGGTHIVLRGITHDIGPAESTRSAPPQIVLAKQVLAGLTEPGTHRAIVNLRTLRLLRWMDTDTPMPGIAWAHDPSDPVDHWIHPDDLPRALEMAAGLARGKAEARLRFRTVDRSWSPLTVTANLVLLDQNTTAGLLTLREG
ncbi:MAG TPA: GAF domain-containing protein [Candidatus Acidoferrum sp.]|nr:GAF domain-containing protein [Candidatus Acidoferrum sp.]